MSKEKRLLNCAGIAAAISFSLLTRQASAINHGTPEEPPSALQRLWNYFRDPESFLPTEAPVGVPTVPVTPITLPPVVREPPRPPTGSSSAEPSVAPTAVPAPSTPIPQPDPGVPPPTVAQVPPIAVPAPSVVPPTPTPPQPSAQPAPVQPLPNVPTGAPSIPPPTSPAPTTQPSGPNVSTVRSQAPSTPSSGRGRRRQHPTRNPTSGTATAGRAGGRGSSTPVTAGTPQNACDELRMIPPDMRESDDLRARATTDARNRADADCATLLASRYASLRQCGRASEMAQIAQRIAPGAVRSRCVLGIVRSCEVIVNSMQVSEGDPVVCSRWSIQNVVSELATQCLQLEGDVMAQTASLAAITDLSWACIDRGILAASAASIAHSYQLSSAEVNRLRRRPLPYHLTDSLLITRLSQFLANTPTELSAIVLQRRSRDLLHRLSAAGLLTIDEEVVVAARALLRADDFFMHSPPPVTYSFPYGDQLEDVEFLLSHGLLSEPLIAEAIAPLKWDVPASSLARSNELSRLEHLRIALARSQSPVVQLARFRMGLSLAIRESTQDPCRRALGLLGVLREFFAVEGVGGLIHELRDELLRSARGGYDAASMCSVGGDGLAEQFHWMIDEVSHDRVPRNVRIDM